MWGLLPEIVLTNRLSGLQAADRHEKLERQRGEFARQIAKLSESALVCRVLDLVWLESAIKNWPTNGRHATEVFQEYNLTLTRDLAGGRFLRWFKSANRKIWIRVDHCRNRRPRVSIKNPLSIPSAFTIDRNCNKNLMSGARRHEHRRYHWKRRNTT